MVKKDFDKEKMYSKIMPSIVTPPPSQEPPDKDEVPGEEEEIPARGRQQYILRNFIEDLVMDKLDHTILMLRGCECEWCKKDVMAKALNELPAAYTVIEPSDLHETVGALRANYEVKVSSALIKAVQAVKSNPRH
ncbi:MAG: late competence development ComFB family protein [Oscillospiraceae bacterium]|nr:late competence development ComFB family protein [Oscillospiraceae bacterium]